MTDRNTANRTDIIKQLWSKMDDSPFVMVGIPSQDAHSVPMTAQFDDDRPNTIWFYTTRDNRLISGMRNDATAMVQFAAKGHDYFACIAGTLAIETDPAIIDEFWSDSVAAWYDQGRNDPKLTMLRFVPENGEFWESDVELTGKVKMLFGGGLSKDDMDSKHLETTM